MSARHDREAFLAAHDAHLIRVGSLAAHDPIRRLARATLGQCDAVDIIHTPGFYTTGVTASTRCTNTGVRIRETDVLGRARHRTVCPKHGYSTESTLSLTSEEL